MFIVLFQLLLLSLFCLCEASKDFGIMSLFWLRVLCERSKESCGAVMLDRRTLEKTFGVDMYNTEEVIKSSSTRC
jgi:hypothetical protein